MGVGMPSFMWMGEYMSFTPELDCAYTLITVPNQVINKDITLCNKPLFMFKSSIKDQMMLPLVKNASCVYSGKFVTHRQVYQRNKINTWNIFIIYHRMAMKRFSII